MNRSTLDGSPLNPPSPPHIQPGFYAGLVINTAVGNTGASRLVELDVGDSNVSGYAVFEFGFLVRAVFVNLHAWLVSSPGARPSVHIDLDFALGKNATQGELNAFWGRQVALKRLVVDHADDVANLTWAGQSYENSAVRPTGREVEERIQLSEGFDIRSTEAVLLDFVTL